MDREIRTAARWWADQLPKPVESLAKQAGAEPGDAIASPMAEGLFAVLAGKEAEHVTPEKVEAFYEALIPVLQERSFGGMGFGTDYGPDCELAEALSRAELPTGMTILPMKTTMWIREGEVKVAVGYGAAAEPIPLVE